MPIGFIYFDLGNVILHFDREIGFRKIAALAGCSVDMVRDVILQGGLLWDYETGELSTAEFFEGFCRQSKTRPDFDGFCQAHRDIFQLNTSLLPVITNLAAVGHRLGLLSNICENQWEFCASGRYGIIPTVFEKVILSYKVGAMKPDPRIYAAAIEAAGVEPAEIFYMDDLAGHVAGALEAGMDAVQYTSTCQLVRAMEDRGIRSNL